MAQQLNNDPDTRRSRRRTIIAGVVGTLVIVAVLIGMAMAFTAGLNEHLHFGL